MRTLVIELRKTKRTAIIPCMLAVGVLGAAYAYVFFLIRKENLFLLPLAPMDALLTQVYGMLMVFNMFGIIVASCMVYYMEFQGAAIKKMYLLPISVPVMYLCKFLILTVLFFVAVSVQNMAFAAIGIKDLPQGTFEGRGMIVFAGYSFVTSMPVLAFMLFIASRFENIWVPLGIGVTGFLSGMVFVTTDAAVFLINPFVVMLKPAISMSTKPDAAVVTAAFVETYLWLCMGLGFAKRKRYE